jgi:hypothetical protein
MPAGKWDVPVCRLTIITPRATSPMACDRAVKCNNKRRSFDSASFKLRSSFFVVGESRANLKLSESWIASVVVAQRNVKLSRSPLRGYRHPPSPFLDSLRPTQNDKWIPRKRFTICVCTR